jgi:hypothetical protein
MPRTPHSHSAIACPGDFDIARVRFLGLLMETMAQVSRPFKLGDVHRSGTTLKD